jgi:hypothetical protein
MILTYTAKGLERLLQRTVEVGTEYPVWLAAYRGIWDQLDTGEGFELIRIQILSAVEESL